MGTGGSNSINNKPSAGGKTCAESEYNMKYSSFEMFGVNVYEKGEWISRKNFKSIKEAIEYARERGSAGYTCGFVTVNKYGCVIDELQ